MTDPASGPRYWVVVPAAGSGRRMGAERPKQYLDLVGRPVLAHTLERLAGHPGLSGIVVAVGPEDREFAALPLDLPVPLRTAVGGAERADSVLAALDVLAAEAAAEDWVLVHDAARPCLRPADVATLVHELEGDPVGGLLGLPIHDTIKRADAEGGVEATVDRTGLWRALTPQMFRLGLLREALRGALEAGAAITDEASAVEWAGHRPRMVEGTADTLKITRPADRCTAADYLAQQATATLEAQRPRLRRSPFRKR